MTVTEGWLEWANRVPGPVDKVYIEVNEGRGGVVCHSMEGSYDSAFNELLNPARKASWMFSLRKSGGLVQHYRVTASPWASGNRKANTTTWSVEAEGVAGEPLTETQVATMLRLCQEWENYTGRADAPALATREATVRTVWQHKEVWSWETINAGPTACPSGRYDGFFAALEERNRMNEQPPAPPQGDVAIMNAALQGRFALMRLALDADHLRVASALDILRKAGYQL